MKERKFKIGDKVTYKSNHLCRSQYDDDEVGYYWGGNNQDGFVGTITEYDHYCKERDCHRINVTTLNEGSYSMLECEFEEYDLPVDKDYKSLVGRTVRFKKDVIFAKKGDEYIVIGDDQYSKFLQLKDYGSCDKGRFASGDCELLPEKVLAGESEPDMISIQHICMKKFPIGCKYILSSSSSYCEEVLTKDHCTYKIVGNKIYAHIGGGCLYNDGVYAQLELPIGSATSSTATQYELTEPIRITHQEAIIIKRVKNNRKLIIK